MAKQQNSFSENLIKHIRHSRSSQIFSMLIVLVGIFGIFFVIALLSPPNYGENTGRLTIQTRDESLRDRISLRVSNAFNRLNFVISRKKDNPEWTKPTNLPTPPDETILSLPDPSIFGPVEVQSKVVATAENTTEETEAEIQPNDTAPSSSQAEEQPSESQADQPSQPATPEATPEPAQTATTDLPLGSMCEYEIEAEA